MAGADLHLDTQEQGLILDVVEALTSSLQLSEVLPQAYALLSRLLPADYAAICVSRPELPGDYEWAVAQMPLAFFARYHEMAAEDFVRHAVMRQPNRVLRDSEMVPRPVLERSLMYRHCRELGMPLEHVMSVLLDLRLDWHGGITLYRERPRPFTEREQALLQRLTPILASTVRNCRVLGMVQRRGSLLESLFHHQGSECVVLRPPAFEVMRTERATALLERWFTPMERGAGGLPLPLLNQVARLAAGHGGPDTWTREGAGVDLKVSFMALPEQSGGVRPWALLLQETSRAAPVPASWSATLTEREREVVACVLKGWDNQLIADELKCSLGTVKKHLQRIFDKLGVDSRAALLTRAARPG
jgi:DNA-binding CsgD family transcriptional regulator